MPLSTTNIAVATALSMLATSAAAIDVVFGSGSNCSTGIALYGASNLTAVDCFALPTDITSISALASNVSAGQAIQFFADAKCNVLLEEFSEDICYTSLSSIGAFQIKPHSDLPKDLVILPTRLSNYTSLSVAPDAIDLTHIVAGIGLALSILSGSLTFATVFTDCYALVNGDHEPSTYKDCISGVVASLASFAAGAIVGHGPITKAWEAYKGASAYIKLAFTIGGLSKRSLGDGGDPIAVGNVTRPLPDGRNSTATLFEAELGGNRWHVASFEDELTGRVYHHLVHANNSPLRKRGASLTARDEYDDERWTDGGVVLSLCGVNTGASDSGLSATAEDNYDNFYDQINCAVGSDPSREATKITLDIFNTAGTAVGLANIVPYGASGSAESAASGDDCPSQSIAANAGCWTS